MAYSENFIINHPLQKVWSTATEKEFLKKLVKDLSPIRIDLQDSFFDGKQQSGNARISGMTVDYSARLNVNDDDKFIKIDVFTDSVDGQIKLSFTESNGEETTIGVVFDIYASGAAKLFVGRIDNNIVHQKAQQAIEILKTKL